MYGLCGLVLIVFSQIGVEAKHEPTCSKFDFEEKVLEKTIRMEIKMEQLVNEMKKTKGDILSITNDVTKKVENVEHNVLKFQRSINESISTFAEKFEQEKSKLTTLSGM